MAGIRLEWAQFSDFDGFDVLRSDSPMDINALPSPIVTGLPTMFYVDTSVMQGATYYYRVVAWRDGVSKVSSEIKAIADRDEHWDKVVSLLHFDGGIIDAKGNTWTLRNSPAVTQLNDEYALYLNGASEAIYANLDLAGTDDLTIEIVATLKDGGRGQAWARILHMGYRNEQGAFNIVCGFISDNPASIGASVWEQQDSGEQSTWSNPVTNDNKHHIAAVRSGGNIWKLFIDGVMIGGFTSSQQLTKNPVNLGFNGLNEWFKGYIHTLRITKGIARYTTNFTPPETPFLSS